MEEKPWLTIDIAGDRSWSATSNHLVFEVDFPMDEVPKAIVLIKDCNSMGGGYVRFIAFDKNNKTYFDMFPLPLSSGWPFSSKSEKMAANQIVYFKKQTAFCVNERYADGPFIRILEIKEV